MGRKAAGSNQEKLLTDFPAFMPRTRQAMLERSEEAARRRWQRLGRLSTARKQQIRGFRQSTGGLWVPASGGENTTVTLLPEVKIKHDVRAAKERVAAKYADEDISPQRVARWASFSAWQAAAKDRGRFSSYTIEARIQWINITKGFMRPEMHFTRESMEASSLAMKGLCTYLMHLKAFTGTYGISPEEAVVPDPPAKRRWIQRNWPRVIASELEAASTYLDTQTTESFIMLTDEALWNGWSREQYWQEVDREYQSYRRQRSKLEPPNMVVPLEVYELSGLFED